MFVIHLRPDEVIRKTTDVKYVNDEPIGIIINLTTNSY